MTTVEALPPSYGATCTCGVFRADVAVHYGPGRVGLCWLCAHAVAVHGAGVFSTVEAVAACSCSREQVYPADVLSARARAGILAPRSRPSEPGRRASRASRRG